MRHLDIAAINAAAGTERRNREVHLPPVSLYRWWARRTESLFGGVLDAFSQDNPGHLLVADPFAGGGVITLAAAMRGHRVYAQDINPWASNGLAAMLNLPEPEAIEAVGERLGALAEPLIRSAYATTFSNGSPAMIAHTLRVATAECSACGIRARLFPHAFVSLVARKERGKPDAFLACPSGHLFLGRIDTTGRCAVCRVPTDPESLYTSRRAVTCLGCGHCETLADRAGRGSWNWEVVLVERVKNRVREIAVPTQDEISQAEGSGWAPTRDLGTIPHGQETKVLLRHGFKDWADLYPRRQRAVTEALLALCAAAAVDDALRNVLRLAILGTTEMAGYLSRWDRWYLKSYESMANHRFDFTTLPTEPNVWGTSTSGRGTVLRRLRLLLKASRWLAKRTGKRLVVEGPLSIDRLRSPMRSTTDARIVGGSSERIVLPARSVDLVLTDPPYHDDVQYHELSLPLRAWAELATEALEGEAVVNHATRQNLDGLQYRELLTRIFSETRRILRPTGHLIFTYGNRRPEPWVDVLAALQEAGFRAAGYAILQSENETDASTSETGPCSLDLVMDVVPDGDVRVRTWKPPKVVGTPEGEFLAIIGNAFLRIGDVTEGWETTLLRRLRRSRWV